MFILQLLGRWGATFVLLLMRRFYFHLFDDENVWDQEGVELPDDAEAIRRGTAAAREMAAQGAREGRIVLGHRIVVCAENNRSIATIHFGDVIEIQD